MNILLVAVAFGIPGGADLLVRPELPSDALGSGRDIDVGAGTPYLPGDLALLHVQVAVSEDRFLVDTIRRGLPYWVDTGSPRGGGWQEMLTGMRVGGRRTAALSSGALQSIPFLQQRGQGVFVTHVHLLDVRRPTSTIGW